MSSIDWTFIHRFPSTMSNEFRDKLEAIYACFFLLKLGVFQKIEWSSLNFSSTSTQKCYVIIWSTKLLKLREIYLFNFVCEDLACM